MDLSWKAKGFGGIALASFYAKSLKMENPDIQKGRRGKTLT